MATGQSTTTQIPSPLTEFYDRVLLERAVPLTPHKMFGQMKPLSSGTSTTIKFRRYSSLDTPLAPLAEGVNPTPQQLAKTDVSATVQEYGTYVEISDLVQYTSADKVLTEAAVILGENAGETLDKIYRDDLCGGTSLYRAGGSGITTRSGIVTKLTAAELQKIVRALRINNAKFFTENPIAGTDKVGTTPIAPAYFSIIHPRVTYDLRAILTTSFIETHKYPNPSVALPGEVGSFENIRFVESTNAKYFPDAGGSGTAVNAAYTTSQSVAADVYTMLIFGKNAYGISDLAGWGLKNIIRPVEVAGGALQRFSTSGWVSKTCGAVILNETFMYRYEFLVSA